ncbi:MAG: hypothetical protein ACHP7N_08125 [Caulobacterales bacterium]
MIAVAIMAGALLAASAACADPTATSTSTSIDTSGNGSQGILGLNQDAGDSNNQGNLTSIAATGGDNTAALASVIASSLQQGNAAPTSQQVETNTINNSFNNTSGIAQVNQVAGVGNVQLNVIAIAFAAGATFSPALTDVELKEVSSPGTPGAPSSIAPGSDNSMNGSFNNFTGIAQVQQVVGDNNVVTNVVAVAVGAGG